MTSPFLTAAGHQELYSGLIRVHILHHACREPVFGLEVPKHVPGVPDALLDPRTTWKDPAAYDVQAKKLTALFRKNFEQFAERVPLSVREAGPKT